MSGVFTPVGRASWPRGQIFWYYTEAAPTAYSMTVSLDVTKTRLALRAAGRKFFPAYLWLVTRAIGHQPALRTAEREGAVGYWDTLVPAYPRLCQADGTTALLWTEYHASFRDFYQAYLADTAQYPAGGGLLTAKGPPPENSYVISCIPWFSFDSFSLRTQSPRGYFFPSFEAGAFREEAGRIWMPLSITAHHAATDGWHLKCFLEELSLAFENPDTWMET
nr:CatA-like O-acetyltransferase [uncultured Oscillibacter sp.]